MPYIKKEYRPNLFKRIQEIDSIQDTVSAIIDLANILDNLPINRMPNGNIFDGAINYTCTQLIRHKPQYAETVINGLISIYFTNKKNLNYVNLKEVGGLFHRMIVEFRRQNWKGIEIVERLEYYVDHMIANPYEANKEEENGGLE
jgi:hypothetical protein